MACRQLRGGLLPFKLTRSIYGARLCRMVFCNRPIPVSVKYVVSRDMEQGYPRLVGGFGKVLHPRLC